MTNKEKIREILSVYHEYTKCYDEDDEWEKINFNYDGETIRIFVEDVEKVKEIIKDLEVLEILKKYVYYNEKRCWFYIRDAQDVNESRFLYKLLKEWLNEK